MNKVRIFGLVLVLIGVGLHFTFRNEGFDFIIGLCVGVGISFVVIGKLKSKK